jgi:polyhydroxybutyrate depolymerase
MAPWPLALCRASIGIRETGSSPQSCTRLVGAGDSRINVRFDGTDYPVLVHVPAGLRTKRPARMVVALHGSTDNPELILEFSGLAKTSDQNGFIVVAPAGGVTLEKTPPDPRGGFAWNAPGVPLESGTFPPAGSRDDIAFLRQVINQATKKLCADDQRVHMTGFSGVPG